MTRLPESVGPRDKGSSPHAFLFKSILFTIGFCVNQANVFRQI